MFVQMKLNVNALCALWLNRQPPLVAIAREAPPAHAPTRRKVVNG